MTSPGSSTRSKPSWRATTAAPVYEGLSGQSIRRVAAGLMPRVVFEKLATLQMLDVCMPTTDGRELLLVPHTEPSTDVALLLVQGEELWVPDVRGWSERGNGDQCGGQGSRMHRRRVLHRELHDHAGVRIGWIAAGERRIGGVRQNDFGSGPEIGEVNEDVRSFADGQKY